jgi:hypothetical protein
MKKHILPALVAAAIVLAPLASASPALASTTVPAPVIGRVYVIDAPQLRINSAKSSAALVTSTGTVLVNWHKRDHNFYVVTVAERTRPAIGSYSIQYATAKGKAALVKFLISVEVQFEQRDYTFANKTAFVEGVLAAAKRH